MSSLATRIQALETALVTSLKKDIASVLAEAQLIEHYLLGGLTTVIPNAPGTPPSVSVAPPVVATSV